MTNWSYVVSLKALEGSGNIFVSVIDGRVPNASSYDYMSNRLTTDVVVMSSNDPIFQKYSKVANIIVVISVEPITDVFEYQFYINGPTPRNSKTMPFNDI